MAKSFKAADVVKRLVANPAPLASLAGVAFGTVFSPHMLTIQAHADVWEKPQIVPFANLSMPPQASCLHYGVECFEGLKAYKALDKSGKVVYMSGSGSTTAVKQLRLLLFRPEMNAARLQRSMDRLCLTPFDVEEFLSLLKTFVNVERDYVPEEKGYSFYLRPAAVGNNLSLSASPSNATLLYVIGSPVGPYFTGGMKPVKLLVEEHVRRAFEGGTGGYKLGANYAGPMKTQKMVTMADIPQRIMKVNTTTGKMECVEEKPVRLQQVLWLGSKNEIQEVGAMNFMCLWRNKKTGNRELRTAPIDGCILPGVTRDSILTLAREWGEFDVSEEKFTIEEVIEALEEQRVEEMFGCGTAAIVLPVNGLSFRGNLYEVPCPEKSISKRILDTIQDIQYGIVEHEWAVPTM